jgi:hypothetical protein
LSIDGCRLSMRSGLATSNRRSPLLPGWGHANGRHESWSNRDASGDVSAGARRGPHRGGHPGGGQLRLARGLADGTAAGEAADEVDQARHGGHERFVTCWARFQRRLTQKTREAGVELRRYGRPGPIPGRMPRPGAQ